MYKLRDDRERGGPLDATDKERAKAYLEEPTEEKVKRMAELLEGIDTNLLLRLSTDVTRIVGLVIEMEAMLLSEEVIRRKGESENGRG